MLENFRKLWYFEYIHGLNNCYIAIHWKVWITRLFIPYFSFTWVHVGFIIYRLHVRFGVQMMGQVFAETRLKPVILIIKSIASLRIFFIVLLQQYNLDISGPILPGIFSKLCQVFEITQNRQFTATTKLLQATTPFNVTPADLKLHQPALGTGQHFLEQCSSLHTKGLVHIKCEDGFYSWETSWS